jgi:hypothetical protein
MRIILISTALLTGCVTSTPYVPVTQDHSHILNACTEAAQYSALAGGGESVDECVQRHTNPAYVPTPNHELVTSCKNAPYGRVECRTISQ